MANFDALRPAVLGPLAFLAREIVKPDALLACFPLTTNILDVSKYGKIFAPSATPSFVEGGPFGSYASIRGSFAHELAGQWSIDFYANFGIGSSAGYIQPSSSKNYGIMGANADLKAICQITPTNQYFAPLSTNVWTHFAITYDGTTFRGYTNGNASFSTTATLNAQTSVTIGYGSVTNVCNLRVVGKVLGTDTTFPVPSNLYTGYEPL